jgi:hypothetical protein
MYFHWFSFYIHALAPLVVLAVVFLIIQRTDAVSMDIRRYLQGGFSFAMVLWCAVFNRWFTHHVSRFNQAWGMRGYTVGDFEHADHDRKQSTPWNLYFRRKFATAVTAMYASLIVLGVAFIQVQRREGTGGADEKAYDLHQESWMTTWGAIMVTVQIKTLGFLWNYIALWLTNFENHRTHCQWQSALSNRLITIKLFNALYPFLYTAFGRRFTEQICDDSLESISQKVGVPVAYFNTTTWVDSHPQSWLGHPIHGICLSGCYPVRCESAPGPHNVDTDHCWTNCYLDLQANLLVYFPSHVVLTGLYIIIQVALFKWRVHQEEEQAKQILECSDSEDTSMPETSKHIGALERQSKRAPYEYMSWGGSMVEDFLELGVGFAVTTCFSLVMPGVLILVFIGNIFEYMLINYRMMQITRRPFPFGAEGIGPWQIWFERIAIFAILNNVGLACFFERPLRDEPVKTQLLAFVVIEHFMLAVHFGVRSLMSQEPHDIDRIDAFNQRFVLAQFQKKRLTVDPAEQYSMRGVDVGLD